MREKNPVRVVEVNVSAIVVLGQSIGRCELIGILTQSCHPFSLKTIKSVQRVNFQGFVVQVASRKTHRNEFSTRNHIEAHEKARQKPGLKLQIQQVVLAT